MVTNTLRYGRPGYNDLMNPKILDDYILKLEQNSYKIVGVWKQGSTVYGYSDKFSDEDWIVVWETGYPEKEKRQMVQNSLGAQIINAADTPYKGLEHFKWDGESYNIGHLPKQHGFFELFAKINNESINEDQLYRLGGFMRGEIFYDPEGKFKDYRSVVKVTPKILANYKNPRKHALETNLIMLRMAATRKHPIDFIKCLNFLLTTFHTILYLENNEFPLPVKWFEREAEKFGWKNTSLMAVVKLLKTQIPFEAVTNELTK